MKRIVITGGSINGNSGAEAMLVTTIKRLQELYPDAQFGIFTPYYRDDLFIWNQSLYNQNLHLFDSSPFKLVFVLFPCSVIAGILKKLRLNRFKRLFPKSLQFLWKADVLIDIAGVSFIDNRLLFLPFNILSIYPAFLLNIPVVKFAQATGPHHKTLNHASARHVFHKCQYIFARGKNTYQHLKSLGIRESQFSLAPDIVFCNKNGDSLPIDNGLQQRFVNTLKNIKTQKRQLIGVCPSSVVERASHNKGIDYQDFLQNLILELIDKGYFPVIFPNATKEHKPGTRRNNDIPLIHDLVNKLNLKTPENSYSFFANNLNADGVKQIIQQTDICIVSRFHAMIFALILSKPVLVLGWSHKYREIMEQFHLEKYVADYQSLKSEAIINLIREISQNTEQINKQIKDHIEIIKKDSYKQIQYTADLIDGNKKRAHP
ncbi:MAG: polysaccharide pyruvyl transferase family protein [Prolixibacteraceae bacterium]|nr:polysaccharide pyruvyl transferase family protein [Prolixibacteraceae bacterium]